MHRWCRVTHLWNTLTYHSLGRVENTLLHATFKSFKVWKWFPRSWSFRWGNNAKSQGAKSGLYGGCGCVFIPITSILSCVSRAVCDVALSWWSIQSPIFSYSVVFSFVKQTWDVLITPENWNVNLKYCTLLDTCLLKFVLKETVLIILTKQFY